MSPEAPGAAGAQRRSPDVAAPAFACSLSAAPRRWPAPRADSAERPSPRSPSVSAAPSRPGSERRSGSRHLPGHPETPPQGRAGQAPTPLGPAPPGAGAERAAPALGAAGTAGPGEPLSGVSCHRLAAAPAQTGSGAAAAPPVSTCHVPGLPWMCAAECGCTDGHPRSSCFLRGEPHVTRVKGSRS